MTDDLHRPRPFCDWHEDRGDVLWWRIPICEPPYVGSPLDSGYAVGAQVIIGSRSSKICSLGLMLGWPFSEADERYLWWTPLPDAKRIEDQVPL